MRPSDPRLAVFRTDASPSIGSGHVRRCQVLQHCLERAGWVTCIAGIPETPDSVPTLRKDGSFRALAGSSDETAAWLRETWPCGADLLVVDSYRLDAGFESDCRPWAKKILVIDDLADRPHDCDLLLDTNYGREEEDYRGLVPETCQLLVGPSFALLRSEFPARRAEALARRREGMSVERVFVSFGGGDTAKATQRALEALAEAGFEGEADVVAGSADPELESLRRLIPGLPYRVELMVDCDRVAEVMSRCDLAIGACGTMTWERFCVGLPSVIVPIADNQMPAARALARDCLAMVAAPVWDLRQDELVALVGRALGDAALRLGLQERGAGCIDGTGAGRVTAEIERLAERVVPVDGPDGVRSGRT